MSDPTVNHAAVIHATVEAFLDSAPDLEEADVQSVTFTEITEEVDGALRRTVDLDGVGYEISVRRLTRVG